MAPVHLSQQFAPPVPQQYQPLGPGIAATNPGMPAPQTQQMQFAQPMHQAPTRPAPPGHLPSMSQSVALPNVQLNRPMSSGMPQPVQSLQNSSSFVPASGAPGGPLASAYAVRFFIYPATHCFWYPGDSFSMEHKYSSFLFFGKMQPNTYPTSQYQVVCQMNLQTNLVSDQLLLASGHQGTASLTPGQLSGQPPQPSAFISTAVVGYSACYQIVLTFLLVCQCMNLTNMLILFCINGILGS